MPSIAVGEILEAVPALLDAVQGGKIMRLISDPAGPLSKAKAGGVLGSARGENGIVQNLSFQGGPGECAYRCGSGRCVSDRERCDAPVLPQHDHQAARVTTARHGKIKEWLRGEELAEVESAEQTCSDIAAHMSAGTPLRQADLVKLNNAQRRAAKDSTHATIWIHSQTRSIKP